MGKDLSEIYEDISPNYRNKIKKASKIVEVKLGLEIEKFYEINKKTFNRQGIKIPYSLEFLKRKHEILRKNNSSEIFFAVDKLGNIHSAIYLIWDKKSAYLHMVGEDPNYRNSGAGILLVWEAIRFSKEELGLQIFDFEGSMLENIEQARRDFGSVQKPYFAVWKINSRLLRLLWKV